MKTISKVAEEFQISARTIRYYEEVGLLSPIRDSSGRRVLTAQDVAKMKLIMRGKKYGFTLEEIKEMVLLFDKDRTGRKQLKRTLEYGGEKLREIDEKIAELLEIKEEILLFMDEFKRKLNEKGIEE